MINLYTYWENIKTVYQTIIKSMSRTQRNKSPISGEYAIIKGVSEYFFYSKFQKN